MGQPAADAQAEVEQLERELAEIELLLQQTRTEAERQEERRRQVAERLPALERSTVTPVETLNESREQLVSLTRRAAIMEGQLQVLEGKQRALTRFRDFLQLLQPALGPLEEAGPVVEEAPAPDARAVLAAAEDLRRAIARQMHDGPAQSITNIALQVQVVQRLMEQQPQRAKEELDRLTSMVQHTLDATKTFIFEVRPMVLDDLGLVATLRRAATERSRRSGVAVRFESVGQDQRLAQDMESGLFRIVDDAVAGFIAGRPTEITARLDWTESEVRAVVRSRPAEPEESVIALPARGADDREVPPALANILAEQRQFEAAKAAERQRATALPEPVWDEVRARASALGINVSLDEQGRQLEVTLGLKT